MTKIAGSESISQRHEFLDPDPYQNVMDPQHCLVVSWSLPKLIQKETFCAMFQKRIRMFWAIRIRNYLNASERGLINQQEKLKKPLEKLRKSLIYIFHSIFNINFTFVFPSCKCLRLHITTRYKRLEDF